MTTNDPLQTLVSDDARSIDRKKVADFLCLFVLIDSVSKQLSFLSDFEKIGLNADKIEIILLACKARSLIFTMSDGLTQGEIIALDTMPEGSAKSAIKRLFDSKKIKKDKEKRYFLPGHRVNKLVDKPNNKKLT